MNTNSMLWHYTFGQNYMQILADRAIKPSGAYIAKHSLPVVWFSRNQNWEPSATKAVVTDDGDVQNLTMEELRNQGDGLYRIGVAKETAPHNWDAFAQQPGVSREAVAELRKIAKIKGASLKDWFASVEPIGEDKWLAAEMLQNHQWISVVKGTSTNIIVSGT